ncbi:MAG TPA: hypothetical protein VIP56_08395, partial [Nitrososphaeraceae archaeon]
IQESYLLACSPAFAMISSSVSPLMTTSQSNPASLHQSLDRIRLNGNVDKSIIYFFPDLSHIR